MNKLSRTLAAGFAATAVLGLAACDVEKTQEGSVDLPRYEVEKTKEGQVTAPEYKVTPPSVDVGTKPAEVTVPKVTTEKETVQVPTVDVKTGQEKKAEQGKQ
jgi:hypothetical protein